MEKAFYEDKVSKTLSVLKEDLNTVRAGRANAALLDQITVDYYGTTCPVKNIANISVPDPRTLMITPFDPSTVKLIEKAILTSNLGSQYLLEGIENDAEIICAHRSPADGEIGSGTRDEELVENSLTVLV